ncbi:hypothetical protein LIA77_10335 [Sarocladium implicatum]|nr:hypothetical protein LIA77_10335 [Sarocladium implicatum]
MIPTGSRLSAAAQWDRRLANSQQSLDGGGHRDSTASAVVMKATSHQRLEREPRSLPLFQSGSRSAWGRDSGWERGWGRRVLANLLRRNPFDSTTIPDWRRKQEGIESRNGYRIRRRSSITKRLAIDWGLSIHTKSVRISQHMTRTFPLPHRLWDADLYFELSLPVKDTPAGDSPVPLQRTVDFVLDRHSAPDPVPCVAHPMASIQEGPGSQHRANLTLRFGRDAFRAHCLSLSQLGFPCARLVVGRL